MTSIVEDGSTATLEVTNNSKGLHYSAWIDFNNDSDFDDENEKVVDDLYVSEFQSTGQAFVKIPSGTLAGNHRLRIRGADTTPGTCNLIYYSETEDYTLNVVEASEMTTYSTENFQENLLTIAPGTSANEIMKISIEASGTQNVIYPEFYFTTRGSTDPSNDIEKITLYYTGNSPYFNTEYLAGYFSVEDTIKIISTIPLQNGNNYFWLTYDTKSSAMPGNKLDAEYLYAITEQVLKPEIQNLPGIREINYCTPWPQNYSCFDRKYRTLSQVQLGTINNITDNNCDNGIYTYSDNQITQLEQGGKYPITFKRGDGTIAVYAWIDFNQNGKFESNEKVVNDFYIDEFESPLKTTFINVPLDAGLGTTRMRVMTKSDNDTIDPCRMFAAGEIEDYKVAIKIKRAMTVTSLSIAKSDTQQVEKGKEDVEMLRIRIITKGADSPLTPTLIFNTGETNNPINDITIANLYYTGTDSNFSTQMRVGTFKSPDTKFKIVSSHPLANDTNYFWLAYNISPTAELGNYVDAVLDSFIAGDSTFIILEKKAGRRLIDYCVPQAYSSCYPISAVEINDLKHFSDDECYKDVYRNYSTLQANLEAGSKHVLTLTLKHSFDSHNSAWIDFDDDGMLEESEKVLDEFIIPSNSLSGSVQLPIPENARPGNHRLRIMTNHNAPISNSCKPNYFSYGEVEDYTANITPSNPIKFISSTVSHPQTTSVNKGSVNNNILLVQIVTEGQSGNLIPKFTFSTNGSSNPLKDIKKANLYYTFDKNVNDFKPENIVGSFNSPDQAFVINGTTPLASAKNHYFWLTYETTPDAVDFDTLDAECVSVEIGNTKYTPSVTSPDGNRIICAVPVVTASGPTSICNGDTIVLTSNIESGIKWSTGEVASTIKAIKTGSYFVDFSDGLSCKKRSNVVSVKVEPKPLISSSLPSTLCRGDSTVLTINNASVFKWSTGQTTKSIKVKPADLTIYKVSGTTALNCSYKDSITINVIEPTTPEVAGDILPADGILNLTKPVTFSWLPAKNASNYDFYIWESGTAKPAKPTIPDLGRINYSYSGSLVEGKIYNYQVVSKNSCRKTESAVQTFGLQELPDLSVTKIEMPESVFAGDELTFYFEITNKGKGSTNNTIWTDRVYISDDTTLNRRDFRAGGKLNFSYLLPGQSYKQAFTFVIPESLAGHRYLIIQTDANKDLAEASESNISFIRTPILVKPAPDLAPTSVGLPIAAFSGDTININYEVVNSGTNLAKGNLITEKKVGACSFIQHYWTDAVLVSKDSIFRNDNSILLAKYPIAPRAYSFNKDITCENLTAWNTTNDFLQENGIIKVSESVVLPNFLSGKYYIYVISDYDRTVRELSEENNVISGKPVNITLAPPPDLVVKEVIVPEKCNAGEKITVFWKVLNQGASKPIESSWIDKLYISRSEIFDLKESILIGQKVVNNSFQLHPQTTYDQSLVVKIPDGISGDYYVYGFTDADSLVFEYDYNGNNTKRSETPIKIMPSDYPDLIAGNIQFPQTIHAGSDVVLKWHIGNIGKTPASKIRTDKVYMSREAIWNPSKAILIGSSDHTSPITQNTFVADSVKATIPRDLTGQYYFYVLADVNDQIFETNEENNICNSANSNNKNAWISNPVIFSDLQIGKVVSDDTMQAGNTAELSFKVQNTGGLVTDAVNWTDNIFLSTDTTLSLNDVQLFSDFHSLPVSPGTAYDNKAYVRIPNGYDGNYFLLFITDGTANNRTDTLRGNNIKALPVHIRLNPIVDLTVTDFKAPSVVTSGEYFEIEYTVNNAGESTTMSGWSDRIYVSASSDLNKELISVYVYNNTVSLSAMQKYLIKKQIKVPENLSGNYYLIVKTDCSDKIYEHQKENNNTSVKVVKVLTPKPSDLIITKVQLQDTLSVGEDVRIKYTIKNIGSNNASGKLRSAFYLTNKLLTKLDRLINYRDNNVIVKAGDSIQTEISARMPGIEPGHYKGLGKINTTNSIYESNADNNSATADDSSIVVMKSLHLNETETFQLTAADEIYYKIDIQESLDLILSLTSDQPLASNEIYVSFGKIPSPFNFDYKFDKVNSADQELLVDASKAGTYFVLVKTTSKLPSPQNISLYAKSIPFSIISTHPSKVGQGKVTTRISGGGFSPETRFQLIDAMNNVVTMASVQTFRNSLDVDVLWDLSDAKLGTYSIRTLNKESTPVVLTDALEVEQASGFKVKTTVSAPEVIRTRTYAYYTFYFENTGNIDIPFVKGKINVLAGSEKKPTKLQYIKGTENVKRRSQFFTINEESKIEDYTIDGNSMSIPFIATNIKPGEKFNITTVFSNFSTATFPVSVKAYGYTREAFIKEQVNITNMQRKGILKNAWKVSGVEGILSLAGDSAAFMNKMMDFYVQGNYFGKEDLDKGNFGCTSCDSDEENDVSALGGLVGIGTEGNGSIIGSNSPLPTNMDVAELTLGPMDQYNWKINKYNGKPGEDPGWDLIRVKGKVNFTSTPEKPFVFNINSFDYYGVPSHLAGWAPAFDKCWPVIIAQQGIEGFKFEKNTVVNSSQFETYNQLYGGSFSLLTRDYPKVDGQPKYLPDTLWVCFLAHIPGHGEDGVPGAPGAPGEPGSPGGKGGPGDCDTPPGKGGKGGTGICGGPGGPGGEGGMNLCPGGIGGQGGDGGDAQGCPPNPAGPEPPGAGSPGLGGQGGTGPGGIGISGGNGTTGQLYTKYIQYNYSYTYTEEEIDNHCEQKAHERKICNYMFSISGCLLAGNSCGALLFTTAAPPVFILNLAVCGAGLYACKNSFPVTKYSSVDITGCLVTDFSAESWATVGNCVGQQYWCTVVIKSCDPNEITGPKGYGAKKFVSKQQELNYTIRFENDSIRATAAAQKVEIRQKLSKNLDPLSFRLKDFGFGIFNFAVPDNVASYTKTLDLPDSLGYDLEVTAGVDIISKEAFWIFNTIDPATGLTPLNPQKGFLAINDETGNGQGFVNYSIKPGRETITGDTILAQADIVFDENEPVITPQIFNCIDAVHPSSIMTHVNNYSSDSMFTISWSGEDDAEGSGINAYDLYVAKDSSNYELYISGIKDTSTTFVGSPGVKYSFFTLARDNVDNREPFKGKRTYEIKVLKDEITTTVIYPSDETIDFKISDTIKALPVNITSRYIWEINTNPSFDTATSLSDTTEKNALILNNYLKFGTTYYIRVKVYVPEWNTYGQWSSVNSFRTENGDRYAILLKPENGSLTNPMFTTVLAQEVPNAKSYKIEISTDSSFSVADYTLEPGELHVLNDLKSNSTYFARVRADNLPAGIYGPVQSFKTSITTSKSYPVDNLISEQIKVYPSLVSHILKISVPLRESILIKIVDMTGNTVKEEVKIAGGEIAVTTTDLVDGTYIVRISDIKGNLLKSEKIEKVGN
jgi:hypothetical protein